VRRSDAARMRSLLAILSALWSWLRLSPSDMALALAAANQQNAILKETVERAGLRPRLRTSDRVFWVALMHFWSRWRSPLIVVRPATVIAWHRLGFRLFWKWKSQGRPAIEREHRLLIRRISREHPAWGEDRIRDELRLKLGVEHSASTIRKYMLRPEERGPIEERAKSQTWPTFLKNHAKEIYTCDFLVQWTATFRLVYVFIVMELGSRRVVHANVTSSPTLAWVKNQIREIAAWGEGPRFLIHGGVGRWRGGRRSRGVAVYRPLSLQCRCLNPRHSSVSRRPLIEPCVQISRTRLSLETPRYRTRPVALHMRRQIQAHLAKGFDRKLAHCRPSPLVFLHQPPAEPRE
jgi:hypothetical protein